MGPSTSLGISARGSNAAQTPQLLGGAALESLSTTVEERAFRPAFNASNKERL